MFNVLQEKGARRIKKSTGIPASFLAVVSDPNTPGAMLLQSGQYAVSKRDVYVTFSRSEFSSVTCFVSLLQCCVQRGQEGEATVCAD